MRLALKVLVKLYQLMISPLLGNHCRYTPSCSNYALGCLHKFGVIKALWLIFLRILRCNPFSKSGHDPVP